MTTKRQLWIRAWWYMPVIPALGRLTKEDHKFQGTLGYIARPYLKKWKEKKRQLRGWRCSLAVQCLPNMFEALCFSPSTTTTKKIIITMESRVFQKSQYYNKQTNKDLIYWRPGAPHVLCCSCNKANWWEPLQTSSARVEHLTPSSMFKASFPCHLWFSGLNVGDSSLVH
jgi:hypothetical protein